MFEQPPREEETQRTGSPERLMKALKVLVEMGVKNVKVEGEENLNDLPPDAKVIVVTSHISDVDVPLAAYGVGEKLNVAITTDSFQHHLTENPISKIGFQIAGQDNFLPIQYDRKTGHGRFNPSDFDAMQTELNEGKAIVMAGHAPSIEKDPDKVAWHLPDKGTIGSAYLAELSGAVLVPVAVDIESETPTGMGADSVMRGLKNMVQTMRHKPDARVIIGKPIILPHIEGIEGFGNLSSNKDAPAENRRAEFRRIRTELETASDEIMGQLASLLPPSKRGVWGESEAEGVAA